MIKKALGPENEARILPKDSNYSSHYAVPSKWEVVRLGDVIEIVRGISFPKEAKTLEPRNGYVACLRTANVQRDVEWDDLWFVPAEHVKRENQYVHPGDILISTANSYELVGKVAPVINVPYRATLGAFISLLRPKDNLNAKFAYYQMTWSDTQDRIRLTASTTTNISNVSTKKLSNIELIVPPLDQQGSIVEEIEQQFSHLDDAVTNLKRIKANLRRYKAAVLKAAVEGRLVETEAEVAQREGRSYETGGQLLQRILETRRSQWKGKGKYKEPNAPDMADLPELPEGWQWTSLGYIGDVTGGLTKNPKRVQMKRKFPYLRVANVYANELRLENIEEIGVETKELEKLLLRKGDLLIVEGNGSPDQIGRLAVWDGSISSCVHQNHLIKVRLSADCIPELLVSWFMSPDGRQQVRDAASSTSGLYTLSVGKVSNLLLPLPPIKEQQRVVAEVERRLSLLREIEAQVNANLQRAERLRQAILVNAFSLKTKLIPRN